MDESMCCILNLLGFISSAATAYIYEFVHRAENIEKKCIVHLSASLAMTEIMIFCNFAFGNSYRRFFYDRESAQMSAIFALSSFLWSLILALHLKKKYTTKIDETTKDSKSTSNDSKLMKKYFLIGYGIPFMVFSCLSGELERGAKDIIVQSTVVVDVVIIVLLALTCFHITSKLLPQIDIARASVNKLDLKLLEYRQQYINKLFHILVIPWLIYLVLLLATSTVAPSDFMRALISTGIIVVIGSQGIFLFFILVLHRKRIWIDLKREYGWKKPNELKTWEKRVGYVSEDDDEEKPMNSKPRLDLLAKIYYLTERSKFANKETNQLPTPKVCPERRAQNMQPAIHQYVGCGVLPGGPDHNDATKKLVNEMV